MKDYKLIYIKSLLSDISAELFGTQMRFECKRDVKQILGGRIFIQITYGCTDSKGSSSRSKIYKGRKWYLSDHMIEDEVIKTAYLAFEVCVKHEILEGFKVAGQPLFNPHLDYKELLKISNKEVKR
jgi:hypothetical protein